jgi:hypothetical protein
MKNCYKLLPLKDGDREFEPMPINVLDFPNEPLWHHTDIGDTDLVSTVFLCLDHAFGEDHGPVLFETMIFGGKHDQYQERCRTYKAAKQMHLRAIDTACNHNKNTLAKISEILEKGDCDGKPDRGIIGSDSDSGNDGE